MELKEYAMITGIPVSILTGRSKRQDISLARQFYWHGMNKEGHRVCNIARMFDRNHSTIIHGIINIENMLSVGCKDLTRLQSLCRNNNQ